MVFMWQSMLLHKYWKKQSSEFLLFSKHLCTKKKKQISIWKQTSCRPSCNKHRFILRVIKLVCGGAALVLRPVCLMIGRWNVQRWRLAEVFTRMHLNDTFYSVRLEPAADDLPLTQTHTLPPSARLSNPTAAVPDSNSLASCCWYQEQRGEAPHCFLCTPYTFTALDESKQENTLTHT